MPDRVRPQPPPTVPLDPLIASARILQQQQVAPANQVFRHESWQDEAWSFYDALGEFNFGVTWLSSAMSRMRLYAAAMTVAGDEPEPIDDGPAAEIVAQLGGGVAGHAHILKSLGVQLSVPGEGWVVGENTGAAEDWTVRSTDEIRESRQQPGTYEVREDDRLWRSLAPNSLVCRVWEPHKRWAWRADSSARSAIPIMREVDLLNRRIIAVLVSRTAMNGVLLIPQEATIDVPAKYREHADPFVAMLIDIASNNIRNPGSASAALPMPIKFPADYIDKWKHLPLGDAVDEHLLSLREKAIGRLATALNMPAEVILGIGNTNHWCVDDSTEILTENGWVTHDRLQPDDVVLTLNHTTGLSEWQPVTDVRRWHVTDLDMVSIEGRYHSSLTTPNHRWPILRGPYADSRERVFATTDTIGCHDFMVTAAPCGDLPTQAKYDDAFVELVAWYFTEGTCHRRPGRATPRVNIYQSAAANPDNVARIRRVLTALFGPPADGPLDSGGRRASKATLERRSVQARMRATGHTVADIAAVVGVSTVQVAKDLRISAGRLTPRSRVTTPRWNMANRPNGMVVFNLNTIAGAPLVDLAPDRIVPLHFIQDLTAAQLELFIDTAVRGDGSLMGGKTRIVGQKDQRMLAAFELAAILSGRSVTNRVHETTGFTRHHAHFVSVRDRTVFRPNRETASRAYRSFTRRRYTGTIWCPVTPNQTWLARRNGSVFYTGNTAWQLEESAVKIHISPVAETAVAGLTVGYLHPRLEAEGAATTTADGRQVVVWYDTSELTVRPDKSAQAQEAYDRVEIGGEAYRRESGFDESDKPTDDEARRMLLLKLAANPTAGFTALMQLFGGDAVSVVPIAPVSGAPPEPSGPGAEGDGARPSPDAPADAPGTGPPPTRDTAPPAPGGGPPGRARAQPGLPAGQPAPAGRLGSGLGRVPPAPRPAKAALNGRRR